MTDDNWKTLRVPAEAYTEAKEAKEANGRTWGQQLTHTESQDTTEVVIENVEIQADKEGVTPDDVETIVERWIENNIDRLKRGQI